MQTVKFKQILRDQIIFTPQKTFRDIEDCEGAENVVKKPSSSVLAHKQQLVVQLRRVLIDEGSIFANDKNQYGVQFTGTKGTFKKSLPREIVSFAHTHDSGILINF